MNEQRSSLYINEKLNEDAIKKGLSWLIELNNQDANKSSALLAVPQISNLKGEISAVLGDPTVKILTKSEKITFNSTVQISLLTERKDIYSWDGPILAIHPTKELLDKIDGLNGVTDVLVIPWTFDEVQYWIDAWSATELGAAPKKIPSKIVLNPLVEVALESLTIRVNLSTGITHPSDRSATIGLFRILNNAGISYNPDKIRAWLVSQQRWTPKGADDVKKVAADILSGKRLKGGTDSWTDNILETWKEYAEKKIS